MGKERYNSVSLCIYRNDIIQAGSIGIEEVCVGIGIGMKMHACACAWKSFMKEKPSKRKERKYYTGG